MLKLDWNLLFTVINLLIFFFIIKKFLVKPVHAIMEKRKAEMEAQLAGAAKIQEEADQLKLQYQESLEGVEAEKSAIMQEARQNAQAEYTRIMDEAQGQAGSIVEKAQKRAEEERSRILREADAQIRDLVLAATEKVAAGVSNPEADQALYEEFLAKAGDQNDTSSQ